MINESNMQMIIGMSFKNNDIKLIFWGDSDYLNKDVFECNPATESVDTAYYIFASHLSTCKSTVCTFMFSKKTHSL